MKKSKKKYLYVKDFLKMETNALNEVSKTQIIVKYMLI